jgi:hypothetical protein
LSQPSKGDDTALLDAEYKMILEELKYINMRV